MEQDPQDRVPVLGEELEQEEVLVLDKDKAEVVAWAGWVAKVLVQVVIVFVQAVEQKLHTRQVAPVIILNVQNAGQIWYGNK